MPERALTVLHKVHSLGETHGFIPMLAWSSESLAKVYESLGNYREANKYSSILNTLKDSVFKMERQGEVLAMDRKYNVAQKQHELEQHQLSIELKDQQLNRRNTLVALSGAFSLLLLLLIFLLYKLMQNKNRLSAREMEQVKLQRDKQMIKALMEGEEKERRRISRELHDGVNGNLAVLKLNLPDMNGIELCKILLEKYNQLRVIAITSHQESWFLQNMLKAGAKGFLLKSASPEDIIEAIISVCRGKRIHSAGNERPVALRIPQSGSENSTNP